MLGPFKDTRGYSFLTDDSNSFQLTEGFKYEEYDRGLVINGLNPGNIFVDVGAGHGFYSIPGAKKGATTYCIEPQGDSVEVLAENAKLNNVVLNIIPFFLGETNDDNAHMYTYHNLALKGLLPAANIDFLKMDIEGYEFKAIRKMEYAIAASPNLKAVIEFCPEMIRSTNEDPEEFIQYLHDLGFTIDYLNHNEFHHHHRNPIIENVSYRDIMEVFKKQNIGIGNIYCRRTR